MPRKKLEVWKKSIDFVIKIYCITRIFLKEELFGLAQQMRWSVVSIISNIAEGCSSKNDTETLQFLSIATASTFELEILLTK